MPLQTGSWIANLGGVTSPFQIQSVDAQGNVTFAIAQSAGFGFWDEDSQRLYLITSPQGNPPWQTFVAYLFQDSVNLTGVTGSIIFTLVGFFEDFGGSNVTAKRSTFGWYAQIGID
jgi:hypothetical protein